MAHGSPREITWGVKKLQGGELVIDQVMYGGFIPLIRNGSSSNTVEVFNRKSLGKGV